MLRYMLIATGAGKADLEEEVNKRLAEGWQLQGGVAMNVSDWTDKYGHGERYFIYTQAMVKEDKKESAR